MIPVYCLPSCMLASGLLVTIQGVSQVPTALIAGCVADYSHQELCPEIYTKHSHRALFVLACAGDAIARVSWLTSACAGCPSVVCARSIGTAAAIVDQALVDVCGYASM
jgi:hypothetical protein